MSFVRWTSKSTYDLADELARQGFQVSPELVRRLLHEMGYSLQAPSKQKEGTDHPDRDAQFQYLNGAIAAFAKTDDPAISVDTKKKELVGEYDNKGRQWQPKGEPVEVLDHDFVNPEMGKAVPMGSTTSPTTRAGSQSARTPTPPPSPSSRSADGGSTWAPNGSPRPSGC